MLSSPIKSLLLFGPTGSGKSPLGWELEKKGFLGRRVHHFDFGEHLRRVVKNEIPFPEKDRELVKHILNEGRLLKPEEFYLAEKVLKAFLIDRQFKEEDLLLLNGLPRNLYQAERLSPMIKMQGVIYLKIDEKTLFIRLKNDPGKDRKDREDDLEDLVVKKLRWFKEENLPLLEYYASKGVKIVEIEVSEEDTGESLYEKLCKNWSEE